MHDVIYIIFQFIVVQSISNISGKLLRAVKVVFVK